MKTKITKNLIINVILIGAFISIVALYIFSIRYTTYRSDHSGDVNYGWYDNLKPIDTPVLLDNMPHYKYIALKQKIQNVRKLKNGDFLSGPSVRIALIIGTGMDYICDTCTIKSDIQFSFAKKEYYISLPGWKLNSTSESFPGIDSVIFHVEHGQSYIRKGITGPKINNKDGSTGYQVHIKDIPVKFRYSHQSRMLKIPVSESTESILMYLFITISCIFVIYMLYLILTFIKFIISLSKGLAFTDINISRLRLIAYSLMGWPILVLLLNLVVRIIFNSYFTDDVVLNTDPARQWWITMFIGFVFLILSNAFKQGKALKDEQELTV